MMRWGLRCLMALVVLAVAGLWLMPWERLGHAWLARLSDESPVAVYSCSTVRPGAPPAMVFDRFHIDFRKRSYGEIETDSLTVRPRLAALLTGRMAYGFLADAYGGKVDGDVNYIRYFTANGPVDASFRITDLDVGRCAFLRALTGASLSGRLKGNVDFSGETTDLRQGSGRALLTVQGCHLPVATGFGRMPAPVHFDALELRAVFDRGSLQVDKLVLSGRGVRSVLRGQVALKKEFRDSVLSLSGKLEVTALFGLTLKFAITGPIAHPALTVIYR